MKISCGHIVVDIGKEQWKELEYLAGWTANLSYAKERYPDRADGIDRCRKSIEFSFTVLDKAEIPYWLQNAALEYGEDWRNRQRESFEHFLKRKGYGMNGTLREN